MLQWVFGEFSVMPVMTSMGMLFTLFHNVHCYVGAHNLADTGELIWWEGAIKDLRHHARLPPQIWHRGEALPSFVLFAAQRFLLADNDIGVRRTPSAGIPYAQATLLGDDGGMHEQAGRSGMSQFCPSAAANRDKSGMPPPRPHYVPAPLGLSGLAAGHVERHPGRAVD